MRKIIALLLAIFVLANIGYAFAALSPTPDTIVYCIPRVSFTLAEYADNWEEVVELFLEDASEELEGYHITEAYYITLSGRENKVLWSFMLRYTNPIRVFMIDEDLNITMKDYAPARLGKVIINYKDYPSGNYFMFICEKDTE